jgi:predicted RNA-binding protein YlqC (UPF0109 family)
MTSDALAEALEHLITGIVHHPEEVQIEPVDRTFEVRVHPSDLGRVIGRGGRTVQALRTVMNALASGRRVRVDIVDTDREDAE